MVDLLVLTNLAQWSLQVALLTVVAAVLLRVLRIDAPVVRHAFWRVLLLVCLALPAVQPWGHSQASLAAGDSAEIVAPALDGFPNAASTGSASTVSLIVRAIRLYWADLIGVALAAGAAARLAWLGLGFFRLRRLRNAGAPAAPGEGCDEIVELTRIGAEIRYVSRLGQPVTFGLFKPVVLLPDSLPALRPSLQRAVLAHELWHVRRRDWAWVLAEETIRAILWFNPAVWWLVSQVQSSREEVVDELTVKATNARKAYLEALLMFADEPTLFPATPFARRRHLFHRMLLISSEAVMSSRRTLTSSIVAAAAIAAASWYGVAQFPLEAAPSSTRPAVAVPASATGGQATSEAAFAPAPAAAQTPQSPPRDRRPGEAGPETAQEIALRKSLAADPTKRDLYLQLAGLQEARGAAAEAEATLDAMRRAFPNDKGALTMLARTYAQTGRFDQAVAVLDDLAALEPNDPQAHQLVAVFYWEKAFKDKSLPPDQTVRYIKSGIASTDRALAIRPDYVDALVYKNILLRMESGFETDPAARQAMIAEADALRNRAMELNRARGSAGAPSGVTSGVQTGVMPPPPPPPPPPDGTQTLVDGLEPLRVGGSIKPPTKLRDAKPAYPAEAQAARVQGVVIIEATIDTAGNVVNARVLRSIPMLDEAAVEAVRQWQFTPTLMNNVPVPVIMTVTVNFVLEGY
jgi:TonB family protein